MRVRWRKRADLPATASTSPVVKIGDNVYVGHGLRQIKEKSNIFKYSITLNTWTCLPHCPTTQHALATLKDKLIVIGGSISGMATNILYTFRDRKFRKLTPGSPWQEVLPPMPTPRYLLSAISHQDRLIITAGGTLEQQSNGKYVPTDLVEIYITEEKKWYTTKRLPFPISTFSITVINDTCYTLGGAAKTFDESCTTLYATVSSLLENAVPANGQHSTAQVLPTWDSLPDKHSLTLPSLVELDGKLATMGGSIDPARRCGTKFIAAYGFVTDTWVECKGAELPLPLYRPNLVKLENNQVLVIGGQARSQHFSSAVFLATYD